VALARALAPQPDALLLDEPFGSLDAELRRTLRRELRATLVRANIPAMLVTHDREEALALGDAVQVIDGGRTLAHGSPLEILGQPAQSAVARLVGVENMLPMRVDSRRPQDGTMVCVPMGLTEGQDSEVRVEVPLGHLDEGDPLTVGIRASDVILAKERLPSSSARNQLPGVVTDVELKPPGYEVTLDCRGLLLRCHITGSSLVEMKIEPGLPLWAVFKASSCFLVEEDEPDAKG
jgi:molybdate transport system ATP-binding protein